VAADGEATDTLYSDVFDRGGRGDNRLGNDWLIGKSRDTFAALGPFVVPKEFVPNVRNMSMRFALNAETLQEGNTSQMIHDVSNSPRTAATS
jgi:2,4-didehydro-3-deoxy-L-rhamnonate hydrolase